ncbi:MULTISPECIES: allophanate hydrolase [unclassified Gordonia (in: high G+C Gram-positive bacteria)]|uniref:allophanate hydrolase n=1 Tax=unclassified Gordonia (in: high G+C Gram-positive bacteria) TaxID=2657482 RepID=UPI0007E9FB46|nr:MULTISPECIES: allophanate hydrolase [unclassified Gordonia (in: high G+C Gram-positive bacteria)]OBC05909.1 allophanate hydrolase [Gordonia sp. 852002-50395_SCH5434458]OBC07067.1 allophanate hydrolase [Gordonia sp. 852002-50816_SCH5313054-a]OBC19587.1 allophanate hydrolase [Gordonia sp. 852002-50816_SCH5313054-c]
MTKIDDIYTAIRDADRPEVFITLRPQADVARDYQQSVASDGPLAGVTLAVKDNVDVAGLPTTAACPGYAYVPDADAPTVAALRKAGAVVIGKTNLDQFATGLVGTRSPYGAVRDSRRTDRISGGSSSGSAVAVALGFADIAIGTDTAGSGRVPAGLQGIVGVKPTVGAISTDGIVPACADYDVPTIFAADLELANLATAVMAEATGERPFDTESRLAAPEAPIIAVPADLPELDDRWRDAFREAVAAAEAAGFMIKTVDLTPFLAAARLLYDDALVSQRYDAVGEFIDSAADSDDVGLDPVVAQIVSKASGYTAVDLLRARRRLAELRALAMEQWGDATALMVPTAPFHPRIDEVAADPISVNSRMGTYTNFCNLFDLCGLAVPAGVVDEADGTRSQFGITLLAGAHEDAVLIDLARRLRVSAADSRHGASAPTWPERVAPSVELAVFGAHMAGGPLTHELSDRGARWGREVRTAPSYRLVALDTTPPKPGLIRDLDAGRVIEGESWVLSPAALGEFLAALPQPMMLGKVELADGDWVVGFGCDAQAGESGRPLDRTRW